MSQYNERDTLLLRLGFSSYDKYLSSALWKRIRERAYEIHGKKCRICGDDAEVLHHKNYKWEVMSGESVNGLAPLCHDCHYAIEFDNNRKRSLDQANNLLARLTGTNKKLVPPKRGKQKKTKVSACPSVQPKSHRGYSIPKKQSVNHKRILICTVCEHIYASKYRTKYATCQGCGATGKSHVKPKAGKRRKLPRQQPVKREPPVSKEQHRQIMDNLLQHPRF